MENNKPFSLLNVLLSKTRETQFQHPVLAYKFHHGKDTFLTLKTNTMKKN